jgi:hypothetical protein
MDFKPIAVLVVSLCAVAVLIAALAVPIWQKDKVKDAKCEECYSGVGLFDYVSYSESEVTGGCNGDVEKVVKEFCDAEKKADENDIIKSCKAKCKGSKITQTTVSDRKKGAKVQKDKNDMECKSPDAAIALIIIAIVLAFVTGIIALVGGIVGSSTGIMLYRIAAGIAFIAFAAAIAGVIIGIEFSNPNSLCVGKDWSSDDKKTYKKAYDDTHKISLVEGSGLGIAGLILAFIAFVIALVIALLAGRGSAPTEPKA